MSAHTQEFKGLEILNAAKLTALRGLPQKPRSAKESVHFPHSPLQQTCFQISNIQTAFRNIYYLYVNIYVYTHAPSFHHFTLKKPTGTTNYF